ATIFVPSPVMTALKPSMTLLALPRTKWKLSASSFHCTASRLSDWRLPPRVVASSKRTSMSLPTHCWNASVRPSAVQESTWPLPPAFVGVGPAACPCPAPLGPGGQAEPLDLRAWPAVHAAAQGHGQLAGVPGERES